MSTAILEKTENVVIQTGEIKVIAGTPYMVIPAGTHTIQIPVHPGTMSDVHSATQEFWKDMVNSPIVRSICEKHGVKIIKEE